MANEQGPRGTTERHFNPLPWLVLILIGAAVPLVIGLGRPGPRHHMEGLSLLTAQETWLRAQTGEDGAWLTPTRNGQVRVRKPPLFVWTCFAAWTIAGSDARTTTQDLIHQARLAGVAMALLLVLSVWWLGRALDDDLLGLLGAAVAATLPLLQTQARLASYDLHLAAWIALAVAAAAHAMLRDPSRLRRVACWLVAIVALAAAVMTKGPVALPSFLIPVVALGGALRRWRSCAVTTAIVLLGALVLVSPWYGYLLSERRGSLETLLHEYGATLTNRQPWHFYPLMVLKLAWPWTLWLLSALLLPFVTGSGATKRAQLGTWLWLAGMVVVFSLNAGKAERYITPVIPAVALLIAMTWRDHQRLAARGEFDPRSRLVSVPHWIMLLVASIAVAPFFAYQAELEARGWIDAAISAPVAWPAAILTAAVLLATAGLGFVRQRQWQPVSAAFATATWMAVLSTFAWSGQPHTEDEHAVTIESAALVREVAGDSPLHYLRLTDEDHPDYDFLLYLRRIVPALTEERLGESTQDASILVIAADRPAADAVLRAHGGERLLEFSQTARRTSRLWRLPPPAPVNDG